MTSTELPTPDHGHSTETPEGIQLRHELLTAAEALVGEFPVLPAGTVIRCFGRAVREVRAAGVPTGAVAVESERLARVMLQLREHRTVGPRAARLMSVAG